MMKIIGSVLITGSCALSGKIIYNFFEDKINFLEDFSKFIRYTKNEIKYKMSYPENIVKDYKPDSKLDTYFNKINFLIANGENFPGAWEKTFRSCIYDEKNSIFNFGKNLGSYAFDEQVSLCDLVESEIKEFTSKMNLDIKAKKKIFITVGACLGAVVSILLI